MRNSIIKVDAGGFWNNDGSVKDIDWLNEPVPRHMVEQSLLTLF